MIGLDKVEEKHLRFLEPWFHRGGPPAEMLAASASGDTRAARALLEREPQLATIPSGEVTPLRLAAKWLRCYFTTAPLTIPHPATFGTFRCTWRRGAGTVK